MVIYCIIWSSLALLYCIMVFIDTYEYIKEKKKDLEKKKEITKTILNMNNKKEKQINDLHEHLESVFDYLKDFIDNAPNVESNDKKDNK